MKNKAGEDTYRPAAYEWQKNRITVNHESKKGAESILIHELDHAIRNYFGKDGQRMSKVFGRELVETDKTTQEEILKNSEEVAKPGQLEAVFKDEVNAYFAERMLTNRQTLERIVKAEPGIKERILSFFKGASADYADIPKLSGSAKWYYKKFKKMFDDFSTRNSEALVNEKTLTNINQGNMSVSDRQYASAVDKDLLEFIDSVDSMQNRTMISKRKHSLGKISSSHAKIIENVFSKELGIRIDASDYSINIDGSAIMHIEEKHGVEGSSDQSMKDKDDIARIGWVVNNADNGYVARTQTGEIDYSYHYKNADGTPSPKIILEKNIGNDTFVVAECVPDRKSKVIHIISARKIKSGNGQVLNVETDVSPQPTSKTLLDGITATNIIPENAENVKGIDENSSDKQFALPLDVDNFVANGEEFATPTLSTVGKERMTYKEKAFSKDWLFTKKTSAYIHAVDEMFGIQVYLEKVGGAKNAKASIQSVRSAPHQAQTMIGSVQYDIFKGNAKSAKKAGEGLNEIFRPIEKQGEKVTEQFNDYLLHQLNVDKYNANEKMKRLQEDAVESLHKVQEEIGAYEARKKEHEKRIFELGDTSVDILISL